MQRWLHTASTSTSTSTSTSGMPPSNHTQTHAPTSNGKENCPPSESPLRHALAMGKKRARDASPSSPRKRAAQAGAGAGAEADWRATLAGQQPWQVAAIELEQQLAGSQFSASYVRLLQLVCEQLHSNIALTPTPQQQQQQQREASNPSTLNNQPAAVDLTTILATVPDLSCVHPRGRFDLHLGATQLLLQPKTATGKTHTIACADITRLMTFSDVNGRDAWLTVGTSASSDDVVVKLNAQSTVQAAHVRVSKEMSSTAAQLQAAAQQQISSKARHLTAFSALLQAHPLLHSLVVEGPQPDIFCSSRRLPGVTAYMKTKDGSLYLLGSGLYFRPGNTALLVSQVRSLTLGAGAKGTVELHVALHTDAESNPVKPVTFSMIDEGEKPRIEQYIQYVMKQQKQTKAAQLQAEQHHGCQSAGTDSQSAADIDSEEDDSDYEESSDSEDSVSGRSSDSGSSDGSDDSSDNAEQQSSDDGSNDNDAEQSTDAADSASGHNSSDDDGEGNDDDVIDVARFHATGPTD